MSEKDNKEDIDFFDGIKSELLKLCDCNPDVVEFQYLKNNLGKSHSFDEMLDSIKISKK